MSLINFQADNIGVISSVLCMLHCIATPFIFIASTCSNTCCESSPVWWQLFDFVFLALSIIAVYLSAKKTRLVWIRYGLYTAFFLLLGLIINNHLDYMALPEELIYVPAALLVILHLYNINYCNRSKCDCNTCQ